MAISESWRKSRLIGLGMSRIGVITGSGGEARFSSRNLFSVKRTTYLNASRLMTNTVSIVIQIKVS